MNPPGLSVIVLCSQSQMGHLERCLNLLRRQTFQHFEVIVVEFGGQQARALCLALCARLNLKYFATPIAGRLAEGFQLAAAQARQDRLICLTAATLLNPAGLAEYAADMQERIVSFGLIGNGRRSFAPTAADALAPSLWFEQTPVAYLDQRLLAYRQDGVCVSPYLLAYPYLDAVGSNFAISRRLLQVLGGFDTRFGHWRESCQELMLRAAGFGYGFRFEVGAWAEQLPGAEASEPPGMSFTPPQTLVPVRIPTRLCDHSEAAKAYLQAVFSDYAPRQYADGPDPGTLTAADAMLVHRPYDNRQGYALGRYQPGKLPDFLIIGTQKGGTTSLFQYLARHRQVSPGLVKEVHFFDREENYRQGKAWYARQFLGEADKLAYEATPEYLDREICAERIAGLLPEARLLVMLRNPIDRAYSAWNMYHRLPPQNLYHEPRSFTELLRQELAGQNYRGYLDRGKYALHLRRFLRYFPQERFLLLDFAELQSDPVALLQRCWQFLGLEATIEAEVRPHNQGRYLEVLPEALRQQLASYFAPFNQQLESDWGLKLDWR